MASNSRVGYPKVTGSSPFRGTKEFIRLVIPRFRGISQCTRKLA